MSRVSIESVSVVRLRLSPNVTESRDRTRNTLEGEAACSFKPWSR